MKNWIKQDWLLLLVLAAPFVFIALVWNRIPERMPIHFDAAFHPNGWGHKPWAPLLLPLTAIFAVSLAKVLFRFDPKMAKCDADTRLHVKKVLNKFMLALAVFLSTCSITMIWAGWGKITPITVAMSYGLPLLFLILGNLLGKLRPNYTMGIRLPWTLESPEVWTKTHRLGGRLLVVISLALLVAAIIRTSEGTYIWIFLGCLVGWSLVVTLYAFALSRASQKSEMAG